VGYYTSIQMDRFIHTALTLIPPFPDVLIAGAVAAAAILGSGFLSRSLKRKAGWPTGYTRKLFHFLIFFTAAGLHLWGGMPAVNILGAGMGIYVVLVVRAGEGNPFFESLAREKDAPRRGYFIVVPYLTTALGGLCSNLFFGPFAVMGYLIGGAADAVAEPVGVRFGKHRFKVPSLRKVKCAERSVEGSLSVLISAFALSAAAFFFILHLGGAKSLLAALLVSAAVVSIEAISPHGADNLTIQVSASGLSYLFLRLWG
jgi:phytol kinase